jgi:hypothetical protein
MMQEMGRVNDFHNSRIVQPVQASVKDTFISLFTPRVLINIPFHVEFQGEFT